MMKFVHNSADYADSVTHGALRTVLLLSAGALAVACPQIAHAQDAGQVSGASAAASADDDQSEEVILVTARRRSESLEDVPVSITAFGAQALEQQGANQLSELSQAVPGLQYSDRGLLQTTLTIRGVGGDARNIGIESGVGMYVDGVYVPRSSGFNADLAQVQQVEILRGPQGTLFGKNTIGGVINIITEKPSSDLEGMVFASYGNYDALRLQAAVSVPVSDTVFSKFTVSSWDRDGYITNLNDGLDYMTENRRGGRAQFRFLASDALEINISGDITRDRNRTLQSQPGSGLGPAAAFYIDDRFTIDADQDNIVNRDMEGLSLQADYDLVSGHTLTYIAGYRDIEIFVKSDVDQLPIDIFHSAYFTDNSRMISQELRLVSPGAAPLRYVAGLYYYNQAGSADRLINIQNKALQIDNNFTLDTDSYAGYLNVDFDILSNLTATGGVRYTREDKSATLFQIRPGINYDLDNLSRTDKNVSWTGSLAWQVAPRFSVYGTVSRGFKSGGFNLDGPSVANLQPADLTFAPESVTNYEVGAKGRLAGFLRFSLAAFQMDYNDKQVVQLVPSLDGAFVSSQISNAGSARIRGFEAEATVTPTDALDLIFTASHLDATYTSFENAARDNSGAFVSFTGNRVEFTPDWTASAQAIYTIATDNGDWVLSGTMNYQGDTFFQPDNAPINLQEGYFLFDARVAYEMDNGLTLALWGKNLSDKDYFIFSRVFNGLDQKTYGLPRTYGVEARFRF